MMVRLARCALICLALTGLVACGGGGSKATPAATPAAAPTPEMQIMPNDEPSTIADAIAITGDDPVSGSLSSPTDVDVFRLALDGPSTVTFWTTGEAETVVTLIDEDGNNLSAAGAGTTFRTSGTGATLAAANSGAVPADSAERVRVTTALDNVYARVTGRENGRAGNYNLHHEATENVRPRIIKTFAGIVVKAGGSPVTVNLLDFFEDPDGDNNRLEFTYSFPAGQVGPISLGVQVTGSILSAIGPAGLAPGPVSISVTATDPAGLFVAQVLGITIQPADNAEEEEEEDHSCSMEVETDEFGNAAFVKRGCSNTVHVRYCCAGSGFWGCSGTFPGGGQTHRGPPGQRNGLPSACNPSVPGWRYVFCVDGDVYNWDGSSSHMCR